jgi:uncharacterized protein
MDALGLINPLYSVSGFAVGLLVGLTGVGGGSLMTPLLILFFGVHPTTAVGTDLLFASVTKSAGTLVHGIEATVDWLVVGRLAAGSVPATILTIAFLHLLGSPAAPAAHVISVTLGVALLLTAVSLIFRSQVLAFAAHQFGRPSSGRAAVPTVITGVVLGVLVSLSSVGAGAIGVTVLLMLYPRLPIARIVGSDIAHAVPLTLLAGIGHWMLGSVDWALLTSLLVGSLPGIVLGSVAAAWVPELVLRPILALTLLLVGGRMLG